MQDSFKPSGGYRNARSGGGRNQGYSGPTLEDFQSLVRAYNELVASYQQQEAVLSKHNEVTDQYERQLNQQSQQIERLSQQIEQQWGQLENQERQLASKDEAIRRQTEDIKKIDAELVWTKAALQQAQEKQADGGADPEAVAEWQDRYKRMQAEMNNLRKRWEQRSADRIDEQRNRLLLDMLPLADHLELALRHANDSDSNGGEPEATNDQFIENIRATQQAFLSTLKRYQVEPIRAQGEQFDPSLHEAVGRVEAVEIPADHIAEVVQTGYSSGDKLLRPARVLVSGG